MPIVIHGSEQLRSVEQFFSANYDDIRRWAMSVTGRHMMIADDVVHDAYLKLLKAGDRSLEVRHPEGYIFVAIRNSFLTHIRKNGPPCPESSPEHEIEDLEFAPQAASASERLFSVCEFVCARRTQSIAASFLILRYFLGYPPEEVSMIVKRSRNNIDSRLSVFRKELLAIARDKTRAFPSFSRTAGFEVDLARDLRAVVFGSSVGECLAESRIRDLYVRNYGSPNRTELGHLVGCFDCLEKINAILEVPSLTARHPLDGLDGSNRKKVDELEVSKIMRAYAAAG